jgi:hypothetical protein
MAKFYTGPFALGHPEDDEASIVYHGRFDALPDVDWSSLIHLSMTSYKLGGILEYATLDGINAGCVAVVPAGQITSDSDYASMITVPYRIARWRNRDPWSATTQDWDEQECVRILDDLLRLDVEELADIADRQLNELVSFHSAPIAVGALTEGLL